MIFFVRSIKYQIKQEYSSQFPKDVSEMIKIRLVTLLVEGSQSRTTSNGDNSKRSAESRGKRYLIERSKHATKSIETHLELAENLLQ